MNPLQIPLFLPATDWVATPVADLPSWANARRVAIDVETNDPTLTTLGPGVRREGYVCGIAFAIEDGPAHYLPIRHQSGTNLPVEKVLQYLRDQAAVFTKKGKVICGANLQYDLDYLLEEGVEFSPEYFRDIQVAEPLLDELQMFYGLDAVAERWGLPGKDERLLREAAEAFGVDAKKHLWRLPPEYVGAYAEQDVRLPLKLLRKQEKEIDEQELWPIYNIESQLTPVLVRMRRRGVRIDFDQLDRVEAWSLAEETKALEAVYKATNRRVEVGTVWKAKALATVLESIGVEVPRTAKTNAPSVSKELLAGIDHPVAAALNRARRVNKVRSTFVESIRRHAVNGRVHCTLNQLKSDRGGGRYGRLSSSDPNLQQQPARDPEIGPMWRGIYVPDEGGEWLCADYSQQEPRWLTHYAELANCAGAFHAAEAYRNDPATDNHAMMAELCRIVRKEAKIIFLGKCYGMGGAKMCHSLGLPTRWTENREGRRIEIAGAEGQSIIDQFDRRAPYVKQLAFRCEKRAAHRGYIKTVLGRRCRFPQREGGGYDWTHKALNRLIQGSSADQTKLAMVQADAAGIPLQLQVHDEIDMTIYERKEADVLAQIMRDCVPCNVPMKVDLEFGPDWGHIS